jgi:acetyl-CoA carboxylase carboxyltransferase component
LAWPTAKIAVMGGTQAAKVLAQIQVASLKSKGQPPSPEEEQKLIEEISKKYEKQTTPYYAAARLWVDEVIDPRTTRDWISLGLQVANNAPIKKFNTGVLQT